MRDAGYVLILCLSWVCRPVVASHFRGAHFWWQASGIGSQVEVGFRVAWRRDYRENTQCDESTKASKAFIGPHDAGFVYCVENCDGRISDMLFQCTDFSVEENWVSGLRTTNYTFPGPGQYLIRWQGRSWLEDVLTDSSSSKDWVFQTMVNLLPRADNGQLNASPRAAIGTIVNMQENCNLTITIPVTDRENDIVRCRWAIRQNNECGGVCGTPIGFDLNIQSCRLKILASAEPKLYAVALQLEDFLPDDVSFEAPLSSVPLQFLVNVYSSSSPCDVAPVFLHGTPQDGDCIGITEGSSFTVTLAVQTKDQFTSITAFDTISALGMVKSLIMRSESSPTQYSVTINWTPSAAQLGQHLFCFAATDNTGLSSEQRCILLSVGETAPVSTAISYDAIMKVISIQFDQQVLQSNRSRFIDFHRSSDDELIYNVISSDDSVTVQTDTLMVQLPPDVTIPQDINIYALLEQGVVQSVAKCNTASAAVTDPSTLAFTPGLVLPTAQPSRGSGFEYRWLVILVAVVVVLFVLLVALALLIRRKRRNNESSSSTDDLGGFPYNGTKIIGYDGPYAPNFHDIEVKFR